MTDSRGCKHKGTKVETASNRLNGVADPEGAIQCVERDFGLEVVTKTTHVGRVDNCLPSFTEAEIHPVQHFWDGILLVISCFVLFNVYEISSELIIKRELLVDDLADLVLAVGRDIVVTSVVSEEDISESCNCRQLYVWVLPFDLHLPVFQGQVQVIGRLCGTIAEETLLEVGCHVANGQEFVVDDGPGLTHFDCVSESLSILK